MHISKKDKCLQLFSIFLPLSLHRFPNRRFHLLYSFLILKMKIFQVLCFHLSFLFFGSLLIQKSTYKVLHLFSSGLLNCRWRSKTVFSWITPSKNEYFSILAYFHIWMTTPKTELWSSSECADSRLSRCTAMAFTPDIQMKYARWVCPQLFIFEGDLFGFKWLQVKNLRWRRRWILRF